MASSSSLLSLTDSNPEELEKLLVPANNNNGMIARRTLVGKVVAGKLNKVVVKYY